MSQPNLARAAYPLFAMAKYYETAPHVIAASISLLIVDILAVSLKFWVRHTAKQPLKADDWLLVPATVRRYKQL